MSGMTSERLAEVRRRQDRAETVGVSFAIDAVHAAYGDREHLLTHVDHLTAENARLREGVALIEFLFDPIDYDGGLPGDAVHARNVARSLLNPPTEGETDDAE